MSEVGWLREEVARLREALEGVIGSCQFDCDAESNCGICAIALRALAPPQNKPDACRCVTCGREFTTPQGLGLHFNHVKRRGGKHR